MSKARPPRTTKAAQARNEAIRKLARRRPRDQPHTSLGHFLQAAFAENA